MMRHLVGRRRAALLGGAACFLAAGLAAQPPATLALVAGGYRKIFRK